MTEEERDRLFALLRMKVSEIAARAEATPHRNDPFFVGMDIANDLRAALASLPALAALSVAPQPQPARECGNCGEPYPGRHIIEQHAEFGDLVICPRHTAIGSTTATHDGFIGACDLCAVHPGPS